MFGASECVCLSIPLSVTCSSVVISYVERQDSVASLTGRLCGFHEDILGSIGHGTQYLGCGGSGAAGLVSVTVRGVTLVLQGSLLPSGNLETITT